MPRFILVDNWSGYIFGDTSDINGTAAFPADAIEAARILDTRVTGVHGRSYETVSRLASNETGYRVYRVDVDGSEAVATVHDGQDQETIAAVIAACPLVATVRCT